MTDRHARIGTNHSNTPLFAGRVGRGPANGPCEAIGRAARTPGRGWPRRAAGLALLLIAALGLSACQSAPSASRQEMLDHYQVGNYRQALRAAEGRAGRTGGDQRAEARYIAGLSAYRLGRDQQAVRYLRPLADRQGELAGEAAATLGLVYFGAGQEAAARRYLQTAAEKLRGPDKGRAYYHLGRLDQRRGQWASARSNFALALSYTNDRTVRKAIRQQMRTRSFALQFGAYRERTHAERRAAEVRPKVIDARVRPPRVVPGITDGDRLYLVQAGQFVTQDQARRARSRLNIEQVIIVPALGR